MLRGVGLICSVLFFSCWVWAAPMPFVVQNQGQVVSSGEPSQLIFDPSELHLGHVVEGEPLSVDLLIRNNGMDTNQIVHIESSCGCTSVEPAERMLAAGEFTTLHIKIDSFGKTGDVKKSVVLTDQYGNQSTVWLYLHVTTSAHNLNEGRTIFDGACASCHFAPAQGKQSGRAIYEAVCVMCHGQKGEGGYAPRLAGHRDAFVLQQLIAHGMGSQYMPAFAQEKGGPLSSSQIIALSQWIISLDD